jgi:hypothetical protein
VSVIALPTFSVPSDEPVARVVEILEEALAKARSGKVIGVALVCAERSPESFLIEYHAEQSSKHSVGAGVLAMSVKIGRALSEDE